MAATLPPDSVDPGIPGLQALPLPEPGLDMFASLRFGLTHLIQNEDWQSLAVLPVDHPLVRRRLSGCWPPPMGGRSSLSYRGKHGHPIVHRP